MPASLEVDSNDSPHAIGLDVHAVAHGGVMFTIFTAKYTS